MSESSSELKKCDVYEKMKPAAQVFEREDPCAAEIDGDHTVYVMCDQCED